MTIDLGPTTTPVSEQQQPLKDVAYERLRHAILSGRLHPGQPLPIQELAESMEMSRTPVREAIRALEAEGLVDVFPSRGTFVSNISVDDIRELFELREALEGMVARLAAQRRTESDLEELEQILQSADAAAGNDRIEREKEFGAEFHSALGRIAANSRISAIREDVKLNIDRARLISYTSPERGAEAVREHHQILEAIRLGDAELAEQTMRRHLRISLQHALRLI
jgi:DNA-binding GntR family transcriptional regulator